MKLLPPDMSLDQYADEFYYDGGEPKETNPSRIVYLRRDYFSHFFWLEDEDGVSVINEITKAQAMQYRKDNGLDMHEK